MLNRHCAYSISTYREREEKRKKITEKKRVAVNAWMFRIEHMPPTSYRAALDFVRIRNMGQFLSHFDLQKLRWWIEDWKWWITTKSYGIIYTWNQFRFFFSLPSIPKTRMKRRRERNEDFFRSPWESYHAQLAHHRLHSTCMMLLMFFFLIFSGFTFVVDLNRTMYGSKFKCITIAVARPRTHGFFSPSFFLLLLVAEFRCMR